jgi:hypothetical protein
LKTLTLPKSNVKNKIKNLEARELHDLPDAGVSSFVRDARRVPRALLAVAGTPEVNTRAGKFYSRGYMSLVSLKNALSALEIDFPAKQAQHLSIPLGEPSSKAPLLTVKDKGGLCTGANS